MATARPVFSPRPSSKWRSGYLLYDGWPAQEGGTDCYLNERRSTRDLLAPSVVLEEARAKPPAKASSWVARYPAWWSESEIMKAAENYDAPRRLPPGRNQVAPAVVAAAAEPTPPPPPPPPAPKTTTATVQTQTPSPRVTLLRSPFMPCMKQPSKPIGLHDPSRPPSATASRVGETLRKERAMRNKLAAARRRRLEAVVSGVDPDEAPIAVAPRPPPAFIALQSEERTDGEAAVDVTDEGVPPSIATAAAEQKQRLAALGLDDAEAALLIAQRFLGSSLGGHFLDAAEGAPKPRSFALHEESAAVAASASYPNYVTGPSYRPTLSGAAGTRVAAAAAGVAAASIAVDAGGEAAEPEAVVGAVLDSILDQIAPREEGEEGGAVYASGDDIPTAPRGCFEPPSMLAPRSLDAVHVATARLGLHEASDPVEARSAPYITSTDPMLLEQAAREVEDAEQFAVSSEAVTSIPAWMPSDLSTATMSVGAPRQPPGPPNMEGSAATGPTPSRVKPTSWEIDVSELRKPAPPKPVEEDEVDEVRKSRAQLRPGPQAGGRRSHAGWTCEIVV